MTPDVPMADRIQMASNAFDHMTQERVDMGSKQYGPTGFMEVDTLRMAMEEVLDLANYARFTFIKLWLLQDKLMSTEEQQVGPNAFRSMGE